MNSEAEARAYIADLNACIVGTDRMLGGIRSVPTGSSIAGARPAAHCTHWPSDLRGARNTFHGNETGRTSWTPTAVAPLFHHDGPARSRH